MVMQSNLNLLKDKIQTTHIPPNQTAQGYRPGDFILTHGRAWTSWLIRFGQLLKYWGENRKYAWWSHAAMIVDDQGTIIEAIGSGVRKGDIRDYDSTDYQLIQLGDIADPRDREQVVAYANACMEQEYGYLTIVCIGLGLLSGLRLSFGVEGQSICSGLVARALERTDAIFDSDPANIMPADLAKYFRVEPPAAGSSKGTIPGSLRLKPYA